MKHLFKSLTSWFVAVFFTLISFLFILEIPASAASAGNGNYILPSNQNVVIIDQTDNETANKTFLDDHLADDLLPSGALGSLVFTNHPLGTIWEINPETIDEIRDMASGYKFGSGVVGAGAQLASAWLTQLKIATSNGIIKALPYSNPSGYWVNRLLPHDSQFLLNAGVADLDNFFNVKVERASNYSTSNYFRISPELVKTFNDFHLALSQSALYLDQKSLINYELKSLALLRLDLNEAQRNFLVSDLENTSLSLKDMVGLVPGKYVITSAHQNLPITVVNKFPRNFPLQLNFYTLNKKIRIPEHLTANIPGNSKAQVLVPVQVVTSGSSGFQISLTDSHNNSFGNPEIYLISARVISPIVSWITVGAALLLFAAVIARNFRKIAVRRKIKHEQ